MISHYIFYYKTRTCISENDKKKMNLTSQSDLHYRWMKTIRKVSHWLTGKYQYISLISKYCLLTFLLILVYFISSKILPVISDCSEYSHQQLARKSSGIIGHFMPLLESILQQILSHCFHRHKNGNAYTHNVTV